MPALPTTDPAGRPAYYAIIPFTAEDETNARHNAMAYAESLLYVRGEVDTYRAMIQLPDRPEPEPLYCGATDDETDVCSEEPGHPCSLAGARKLALVRPTG